MGLIANYSCLSDVNLKELKAMGSEEEEILESVEEWNDDDELLLDIDKMWDVLHFVLTGVGTDHKDDKNPLSQAVLGVMAVEDISDYVAYTEHNYLANIVTALEQFDLLIWQRAKRRNYIQISGTTMRKRKKSTTNFFMISSK